MLLPQRYQALTKQLTYHYSPVVASHRLIASPVEMHSLTVASHTLGRPYRYHPFLFHISYNILPFFLPHSSIYWCITFPHIYIYTNELTALKNDAPYIIIKMAGIKETMEHTTPAIAIPFPFLPDAKLMKPKIAPIMAHGIDR